MADKDNKECGPCCFFRLESVPAVWEAAYNGESGELYLCNSCKTNWEATPEPKRIAVYTRIEHE